MATEAQARFTVLVEIKKPGSSLLGKEYRNKVYKLGADLTGGVAGLQSNRRTWVVEGSRQDENREALKKKRFSPLSQKALLS
jgi:hypothetical protein